MTSLSITSLSRYNKTGQNSVYNKMYLHLGDCQRLECVLFMNESMLLPIHTGLNTKGEEIGIPTQIQANVIIPIS